ncbi:hypothetical protein EB155_03420 [archaeon]|nr:hypothetical protein [archaeon]NDB78892.1 hypothetical protein [archaeon]
MSGYDSAWQESFLSGPIGSRIDSDFENIVCDPTFILDDADPNHTFVFSNEWPCETPRDYLHNMGWCSILPFYYIEKLQENNPTTIYDLGCGNDFFARYYDNIIGIDMNIGVDIDDEWFSEREGTMEAFVSFNGLNMQNPGNIGKYKNLLTDTGRGVITFSGRNFEIPLNETETENIIRSHVNVIEYETVIQPIGFDGATRVIFSK